MNRYEVVVEDTLNAYILDKTENKIVVLCSTKRPDLGFEKLNELVKQANNCDKGAYRRIIEKQIPKNPIKRNLVRYCPDCGNGNVSTSFCPYCGQSLDWSE